MRSRAFKVLYLVPIAGLLYGASRAIPLDVFNRAVTMLASAVWGS
jgi:hypothetical protein